LLRTRDAVEAALYLGHDKAAMDSYDVWHGIGGLPPAANRDAEEPGHRG
jgi:hypothetical protein